MSNRSLNLFVEDLTRFGRTVPQRVQRLQRMMAFEALGRLVEKTPEDTGRAKGGWNVGVNWSTDEDHTKPNDPGTYKSLGQLRKLAMHVKAFSTVHLFNNVFYIKYLEYGTPKMRPRNMVKRTQAELESIFGK